jgi:hypothetical protein
MRTPKEWFEIERKASEHLGLIAEVARLRTALEKLTVDEPLQGRVFKGNADLPGAGEFYRAYNVGIKAQFEYSSGIARAALAPANPADDPTVDLQAMGAPAPEVK